MFKAFLLGLSILASAESYANDTTKIAIKLPAGFQSTVVANNLGQARHLAINSNGDIYVKLNRLKNGKGILKLTDINGDGKADKITSFAGYAGTGIVIKNGYLYASSNKAVFRYKLNEKGDVAD